MHRSLSCRNSSPGYAVNGFISQLMVQYVRDENDNRRLVPLKQSYDSERKFWF